MFSLDDYVLSVGDSILIAAGEQTGDPVEDVDTGDSDTASDTAFADSSVYYAKFIDADVFNVLCAYTLGTDGDALEYWRFVSSVDSFNYSDFSFIGYADGEEIFNLSATFYTSFTVTTLNKTFLPSDFSSYSYAIGTQLFSDSSGCDSYTVVPVIHTLDGTTVCGSGKIFTSESVDAVLVGVDDTDYPLSVYGTDSSLGVSSDASLYVPVESFSGEGTGVMYAAVDISDISLYYTTESYPTTSKTFTEDGEEHNYIFAGWYEDDSGEVACTSVPYEETSDSDGSENVDDSENTDATEETTLSDIYEVMVVQSYLSIVIAFGVFLACGVLIGKVLWERLK